MKKRISALFIALVIALSCITFAGAAKFPSFVVDYTDTLSEDEIYALNELSNNYYKKYNTEISYAIFEGDDSEEIVSEAENLSPATNAESRILLAVNDDYWYVVSNGTISGSIDDSTEEAFFNSSVGDDRYDGIQSYITDVGNYVTDFFDAPEADEPESTEPKTSKEEELSVVVSADSTLKNLPKPSNDIKKGEGFTGKYPHIMDTAKLLSKEDVSSLEKKLSDLSEKWQLELVVVTAQDSEGLEVSDYAEQIFTFCDYGYGESKDGILLLLSMKERDWYIATHGYGKTVLPDWRVESVGEKIVPGLSAGNYAKAFSAFADECADYADAVKNGYDDSDGHSNHGRAPLPIIVLPICFGIGLIIAVIVVLIMKSKLKTAVRQREANTYIKEGSFHVTESSDQFLYSNVTQTRIAKDDHNSSSGGNDSSGSSFGGGGGKF